MTVHEVVKAWNDAQRSLDFYASFEKTTGLTSTQINVSFRDWNNLPHADAVEIAARHGVDVKEAGFQAHLADIS